MSPDMDHSIGRISSGITPVTNNREGVHNRVDQEGKGDPRDKKRRERKKTPKDPEQELQEQAQRETTGKSDDDEHTIDYLV